MDHGNFLLMAAQPINPGFGFSQIIDHGAANGPRARIGAWHQVVGVTLYFSINVLVLAFVLTQPNYHMASMRNLIPKATNMTPQIRSTIRWTWSPSNSVPL